MCVRASCSRWCGWSWLGSVLITRTKVRFVNERDVHMTRLDLKRLLSILPQRDGDRRDDALMANQLWNDNSWQTNHISNCIRNIEWTLETITDKYIGLWPNRGVTSALMAGNTHSIVCLRWNVLSTLCSLIAIGHPSRWSLVNLKVTERDPLLPSAQRTLSV